MIEQVSGGSRIVPRVFKKFPGRFSDFQEFSAACQICSRVFFGALQYDLTGFRRLHEHSVAFQGFLGVFQGILGVSVNFRVFKGVSCGFRDVPGSLSQWVS